jgi:ribonuclease HI
MDNIIQWNCRGFKANFDEIRSLASDQKAGILCLQETFLKPLDNLSLRKYHMYNTYGSIVHDRATGGSTILVRHDIIHSHVNLNTSLQATAVRVTLHRTFTICSLYISPSVRVNIEELNDLYNQLTSPCLILGDFNGHSPLWGSPQSNNRGNLIEDFIDSNHLCLYNDGSSTFLHSGHGTYSAIDLSLSDPSLFLDFHWEVLEDTHGSDHFPILLKSLQISSQSNPSMWKFNKADWETFSKLCLQQITETKYSDSDSPVDLFTNDLIDIADKAIPKSKSNPCHISKPWFDSEVKDAIRARKRALRQFSAHPTEENLNNFRILRAKARRIVRQKKRTTWRNYVSKLSTQTPSSKVWTMIKRIQGRDTSSHIQHLTIDGEEFTTKEQIVNKLAQQFSFNSSSDNYTEEFKSFKDKAERHMLNFHSEDNSENYNSFFSLEELHIALNKAKDSATGADKIHYQLLKHLPELCLKTLLGIFNKIWDFGTFPNSWRMATVIPIPKPNKDHSDPLNYRPIALTSCLCKTMERMINNRLVWFIESNELFTEYQCGFRSKRSTLDHLVAFETYIRDAFISREHVVAIFFDLEKAYDTTWKYGIMKDLHDFGLRGRLPYFIDSFLKDRIYQVRIGTTMSDDHTQEMGVPQGSILSPTCFNIKINNIVKSIKENTMCSLYVDDFLIAFKSKNMVTIERQLQLNLNRLQKWSQQNGFKFSKNKTVCMHFCQLRNFHPEPSLKMDNAIIKVVKEHKFLGILLDSKLSFIPHITDLKRRCFKSLNLLKVVSNLRWGGDTTVLLRLYRAMTRSRLDYGCIVYGSARSSYLRCLNTIHHQGLRLSLGAFRTSPVESLYVLAREPSLALRRIKLSLQYLVKLAACPNNPAFEPVFHPKFVQIYEAKEKAIRPLGLRMKFYLDVIGKEDYIIDEVEVPTIPPWKLAIPNMEMDLSKFKKAQTNPIEYQAKFNEIKSNYHSHKFLYTDGSKDGFATAYAVTSTRTNYRNERIPDISSIFTAELTAIYMAVKIARDSDNEKFVICSDSKSALQALENKRVETPLVKDIIMTLTTMDNNKEIVFCWLPSHVDIRGNETADFYAKKALNQDVTDYSVPYTDFRKQINDFIMFNWQRQWNSCENNKLHSILPSVTSNITSNVKSRRDQAVIHRCLIGHSRLTHSHLLVNSPSPMCEGCQSPLTIKHILIECNHLSHRRPFQSNSLRHLFTNYSTDVILNFLHANDFYYKI